MTILDAPYLLMGIMFATTAIINLRDSSNAKRWKSAGFWGINAIIFIFGSYLPPLANGILVIVMVLLAGLGGLGRSGKPETSLEQREVRASRFGNRLFILALLIPLVTLLGTFAFKSLTWNSALLIPAGSSALAALGLGIIVAFFAALVMLHETPASAMHEGRGLLDAICGVAIAGQGTLAIELLQQDAHLDRIFVPVGGGGLAAGVAVLIKHLMPQIKIIGVEAEESAWLAAALQAGAAVDLPRGGLFAEGVAVRRIGDETFRLCSDYLDDVVTVDSDSICAAVKDLFEDVQAIAEPSGTLALAGMKRYIQQQHGIRDERLAHVLSGANVNFHGLPMSRSAASWASSARR
ncbi:MAG: pyridoxal-phosphate dependent enzyme [Sodalis sp. (in: enterobacteria)]|uniref:pyridoxal-phosphate dependent enzyme n=1 Tax=Sodalis sp. (in: enterobacteria) TaxID=1898979 RepID=UPI003F41B009